MASSPRMQRMERGARPVRPNQPKTWRARAGLAFQMVPKAVGLVWEATPGFATGNAFLTVAQGVLPAITLYFSKAIVDGAAAAFFRMQAHQPQTRAETQHVLTLVALWFGVQLLASLLQTMSQLISSLQSDLLSNYISVRLM